jgi:hypothetical protein
MRIFGFDWRGGFIFSDELGPALVRASARAAAAAVLRGKWDLRDSQVFLRFMELCMLRVFIFE